MWYNQLKETIPAWLHSLRYNNTGRYRLSESACHPFSIDATSLALDLHLILDEPIPNLDDSINFFHEQQEAETGFYHEPFRDELDHTVDRVYEMSGTYFGYQVSAVLMALEISPRFKFDFYRRFLTTEKISDYMRNFMPWDNAPMGAGNMVDHGATMMRCNILMGEPEYNQVLKEMYAWLDSRQDTETGLWGNINAQGKNGLVQAGYHLMRGTYFYDNKAPNYIDKMTDTALASLEECTVFREGAGEGCHDMDHFVLLERALHYSNGYREGDVRSAVSKRLEQLKALKRDDGAFSFMAASAITNHNRYEVTPGKLESDLVGTVFYMETIYRMKKILKLPALWNSSVTHGVSGI
jgi:hypothetical protein